MSPVFPPERRTAGSMASEGRAFQCSGSPEPLQSVKAHRRTKNSIIGTGADDSLSENIATGCLLNSLAVNGKSSSSHFPPLPLAKALAEPSLPQSSFNISSLLTSSAGSPPKLNLFKGVLPSPVSSPQSRAHVPAMPRGKLSADPDDLRVAFISSRRTGGKVENKRDAYSAFPPSPDEAWSTIQSSKKAKARTVNPSSVSQRQPIVISKGFRLPLLKTEPAQAKKASMTYRPPPRRTAEQANAGPTVTVFHPHTPESLSRPSLREDRGNACTSSKHGRNLFFSGFVFLVTAYSLTRYAYM
ncbi:uncharacterized protein LAESUDRAFT_425092 [Laetiporus sulphureus 93-53]|uniref:Uncharacterized protein n=1 Tax=Laetiporus sulphureus 93-53 TaxID=1314785 RepID=A0A165GJ04_9APHY|nr:uncharacterized protein LAESUDRAFT_425092 [Laetiporus sulphureus 93-53]KZT10416.1 hypothetical protein LAESUDRAFT_425092 [Laetiporus sulphureus 93-53]